MLNSLDPQQFVQHRSLSFEKRFASCFRATMIAAPVAAVLIISGIVAWNHYQSLPLTETQLVILSSLAGEASSNTKSTRQAVWERVKKDLGVRRIQDIKRRDFERAQDILILSGK